MKQIILFLVFFIIFLLSLSLWGFYWALYPLKIRSTLTPADFQIPFEKVIFPTEDNVSIHGWYLPHATEKTKAIILLHGYPADKGDIFPSRAFLHKKYNLLFLDFRYLGESGGSKSTLGKDEILDVKAAISYLNQRGIKEIGIWGFSMGAAVALMAAAHEPSVKAIVAESSYAELNKLTYDYFRIPLLKYPLGKLLQLWSQLFLNLDLKEISPVEKATQLHIPLLILHSKKDEVISYEHAELFQKRLKNKKQVQIHTFEDLSHGQSPPHYESLIGNFFDQNLPTRIPEFALPN